MKTLRRSTLLYIDTSESERTRVALEIEGKKFSFGERNEFLKAQALLPLIEKALKKQKLTVYDIGAIRVNPGPGSFTGLRVGVAVANTLGWVLGIPVNGKKVEKKPVEPIYI